MIFPVRVQLLFWRKRTVSFLFSGWWINWLLVSWVSFWCLRLRLSKLLVFATFFSSATLRWMYQSCFWLWIALTWLSMGQYYPLHFCRVFVMVWIAPSTNPLFGGNSGLEVSCMKSHDSGNLLNSCELYCGPLSQNATFGMPFCANIQMDNGKWWGIWQMIHLVAGLVWSTCWCNL